MEWIIDIFVILALFLPCFLIMWLLNKLWELLEGDDENVKRTKKKERANTRRVSETK